jgi:hypothetical protein
MDIFSPFSATKRKRGEDQVARPPRIRHILYQNTDRNYSTDIPATFPPLFHEIASCITSTSNDSDIRTLDVAALVLVGTDKHNTRPVKFNVKGFHGCSSIECKIGGTHRAYVMSMDGTDSIVPYLERLQTGGMPVFIAVFNYQLRLMDIEPMLKGIQDAHPVQFDPAKLPIPPKFVLSTIKYHIASISQDDQADLIKSIQSVPQNAASPDFQFQTIAHAVSLLHALPIETTRELRRDLYRPIWASILNLTKIMK